MLYIWALAAVILVTLVVFDVTRDDDHHDRRMRESIGRWHRVRRSLGGR